MELNISQLVSRELTENTAENAFNQLVHERRIGAITLLTFCYLLTPIIEDESGEKVGAVASWVNGKMTVCQIDRSNSEAYNLIAVYDSRDPIYSPEKAVKIYERALKEQAERTVVTDG